MTFLANKNEVQKTISGKQRLVVTMVLGIIIAVLGLALGASGMIDEMSRSMARDLNTDPDTVRTVCWCFIGFAGIMTIPQGVGIGKLNTLTEKLNKSYITVGDTAVKGIAFSEDLSNEYRFDLPFQEVKAAYCSTAQDGFNLTIKTENRTYQCLAIEDAGNAVALINQRISGNGK